LPPPRELVWLDRASGGAVRRFRLLDSLTGPGGGFRGTPHEGVSYDLVANDVSYCPRTDRVAVAWNWSSIEDPSCVYDLSADAAECFGFWPRLLLYRLAFAPDGRAIVLAAEHQRTDSYVLQRWPADTGGRFTVDPGSPGPGVEIPGEAVGLAFDGRYAAVKVELWVNGELREDGAYLWDTGAGPVQSAVRELAPGFAPRQFGFAAGAPLLAVGGDGLAVWHLGEGRWAMRDATAGAVTAVAMDPAGLWLAAGTPEGTLELRGGPGWRATRRLATGTGRVTAAAFAPDGLTCASGGSDGQVAVWDVDW
jgi:hypothetical protein